MRLLINIVVYLAGLVLLALAQASAPLSHFQDDSQPMMGNATAVREVMEFRFMQELVLLSVRMSAPTMEAVVINVFVWFLGWFVYASARNTLLLLSWPVRYARSKSTTAHGLQLALAPK